MHRISFCIRHEIIFLDYLIRVKTDISKKLYLVIVKTDISVDLILESPLLSVIAEDICDYEALRFGTFETSVFAHAHVVSVTALVAELSSAERCSTGTYESGIVKRSNDRNIKSFCSI